MTELEKFINNVTKNGVENSVYSTDDEIDTYTILGKLNEILKFMQDHPDMKGTIVKILSEAQDFIDFSSDPQTQLDNLRQKTIGNNNEIQKLVESDTQINDHIAQLIDSVTRLDLNKADALTVKLDSVSEITSLETFRTALYNLRKSPQRSYQLQEAEAKRVLNIIGYPIGLSQDTNILLYVDLPYSEAGGFEIDITAMGRNGKHLYKRTMYSTLNVNWQDTGWSDASEQMASIIDINNLIAKGNNSWGMVPSLNNIDNLFADKDISPTWKTMPEVMPANGYLYLTIRDTTAKALFGVTGGLFSSILPSTLEESIGWLPVKKGDQIKISANKVCQLALTRFIFTEEI